VTAAALLDCRVTQLVLSLLVVETSGRVVLFVPCTRTITSPKGTPTAAQIIRDNPDGRINNENNTCASFTMSAFPSNNFTIFYPPSRDYILSRKHVIPRSFGLSNTLSNIIGRTCATFFTLDLPPRCFRFNVAAALNNDEIGLRTARLNVAQPTETLKPMQYILPTYIVRF